MNQVSPEFFAGMQSKALESLTVVTEMNHRILQELIGFSASAAKEGLRAYSELQSAAIETARATAAPIGQAETTEAIRQDPFAWYQKGLLTLVEGAQKTFRLLEANAQVVTRSTERFQASTERTAQEIQEALTSSVGRVKEIYAHS